jgi:hypothetical protein
MLRPLIACSVWLAAPLAAQRIPVIRLAPAEAVHSQEFTSITSVRELRDGRALVGDFMEDRILLLDFSSGATREIGRIGRGPREFSMVMPISALAGDSSLMVDLNGHRWLLFHADSIVDVVPPDHPAIVASQTLIHRADTLGWALLFRPAPRAAGARGVSARDSSILARVHRTSGRMDTVAKIRPIAIRIAYGERAQTTAPAQLMPSAEGFAYFPDGVLAIARLDPFRVDWRLPDGRWQRGDSLPVPPIRVTARERRAWEERMSGVRRVDVPGAPPPPATTDFPAFVPPFEVDGLMAGPRGLLFVRRYRSADVPANSYFVIDRSNRILGTFTLAPRERLEGASDRYLYISVRDEDDILRLRRHRWQ